MTESAWQGLEVEEDEGHGALRPLRLRLPQRVVAGDTAAG